MREPRVIDRSLLDQTTAGAIASPRGRKNFNFHASEGEVSNRLLNAIEPGSYVQPHRHAAASKDETLVVVRGRLAAVFFDDTGRATLTTILAAGGERIGVDIPHGTYHTLFALEPGTIFFEAKAGPYATLGPEERAPWAPAEGTPEATAYLARLSSQLR
jgi:cupin fold WbuC family metalloprotein